MATAIESGIGTLNYGKQSAKGSIATAATTTAGYDRPKWVSGNLRPGKMLGQEEYIDGQRFSSPAMFTDRVGGDVGEVTVQLQPENAGLYYAQILGSDTVTGAGDPYTHTITSAGTGGAWGTWWQKVGSAVGPQRELYYDSKLARHVMECGVDQKVMHGTFGIQSLKPGRIYTTDAAKTETTTDPFIWTEVTGSVTFDSTVVSEVRGETVEIDTAMEPFYGDTIAPVQLIEGKGTIVRTLRSIVTDDTLQKYRKAIWNDVAPAAGTDPVKDVFYADVQTVYTRSASRTLTLRTQRVAVRPDDMVVAPLPEGGTIDLDFGGPALKAGTSAGQEALRVIALTGDSAAYV